MKMIDGMAEINLGNVCGLLVAYSGFFSTSCGKMQPPPRMILESMRVAATLSMNDEYHEKTMLCQGRDMQACPSQYLFHTSCTTTNLLAARRAPVRTNEEIQTERAHIEYLCTMLNTHLALIEQESERQRLEHIRLQDDIYAAKKDTRRLAAFFKEHGLYIVDLRMGERTQDQYALAKQIWRARTVCLPFIKALSRNKEPTFVFPKQALSPTEASDIRNLCDTLKNHGYLAYDVKPDGFEITPFLKGAQKGFLSGTWAEEVTLYLIDKALKTFAQEHGLGHKLFWDVRLKRINSDRGNLNDMQLDLVAEVGNRFYIFETKSGFVLSIDKWVDRTRLFDGGMHRFITCTADDKLNPLIFKPFRLFALQTLEEQFTGMLREDFPAPALTTPIQGTPDNA